MTIVMAIRTSVAVAVAVAIAMVMVITATSAAFRQAGLTTAKGNLVSLVNAAELQTFMLVRGI